MSEQDKMTEQETEVTTSGEAPQEKKKQEVPTRSMILMILAGCYLVYTGYRLCKNVLDGVEGGSWGFFAAGAAFIVVGAVMLFVGGRNYLRREKEKRAEQEAQAQIIRETQPAKVLIDKIKRRRIRICGAFCGFFYVCVKKNRVHVRRTSKKAEP